MSKKTIVQVILKKSMRGDFGHGIHQKKRICILKIWRKKLKFKFPKQKFLLFCFKYWQEFLGKCFIIFQKVIVIKNVNLFFFFILHEVFKIKFHNYLIKKRCRRKHDDDWNLWQNIFGVDNLLLKLIFLLGFEKSKKHSSKKNSSKKLILLEAQFQILCKHFWSFKYLIYFCLQ